MKLGKPGKLGETRAIGNFRQAGNAIGGKKVPGLGKFMVVFEAREAENEFEAWIGRGAGKAGDWENW